jgi:hypothetical protein
MIDATTKAKPDTKAVNRISMLMDIFPEYKLNPSQLTEDLTAWIDANEEEITNEAVENLVDCIYAAESLQTACADIVTKNMMG